MTTGGARFLGHQIHPMLIVFPLGVLPVSFLFDILYLISRNEQWARVSFYLIPVGVLGGLVAAVFGLIDWLSIPRGTRARRVGVLHGLANVVVVGLFGMSWVLRVEQPEAPETVMVALSGIGLVLASFAGWLGGELVERHGVGVSPDADLNATSSLAAGSRRLTQARVRPDVR